MFPDFLISMYLNKILWHHFMPPTLFNTETQFSLKSNQCNYQLRKLDPVKHYQTFSDPTVKPAEYSQLHWTALFENMRDFELHSFSKYDHFFDEYMMQVWIKMINESTRIFFTKTSHNQSLFSMSQKNDTTYNCWGEHSLGRNIASILFKKIAVGCKINFHSKAFPNKLFILPFWFTSLCSWYLQYMLISSHHF